MKILNEINGTPEKRVPKHLISRARKVSNHTIFGARYYRFFVTAPSFFPVGLPFIRPSHLSSLTAENNVISANNSALLQKDRCCRSPEDRTPRSSGILVDDSKSGRFADERAQ